MPKDRARQFMPFNSLNGYFEMLEEVEVIKEEKKELTEEEIKELNDIIYKLKKGMIVRVFYYDIDCYKVKEGILSKIQLEMRYIIIVKMKIMLDSILKIEIL